MQLRKIILLLIFISTAFVFGSDIRKDCITDANSIVQTLEYQYPDKGDVHTLSEIARLEPYPGYWVESNKYILSKIMKSVMKLPKRKMFLEIGAGQGRLSKEFVPLFEHSVLVEPDKSRFDDLRKGIDARHGNVSFVNKRFQDMEDAHLEGKFDLIVCAHVIEHMGRAEVLQVIEKSLKLLSPNGVLVVLTTYAKNGKDVHRDIPLKEGLQLPLSSYSFSTLKKLFKAFTLEDFYTFHFCEFKHPKDRFINFIKFFRRYFGKDIYLIFRKK